MTMFECDGCNNLFDIKQGIWYNQYLPPKPVIVCKGCYELIKRGKK